MANEFDFIIVGGGSAGCVPVGTSGTPGRDYGRAATPSNTAAMSLTFTSSSTTTILAWQ